MTTGQTLSTKQYTEN